MLTLADKYALTSVLQACQYWVVQLVAHPFRMADVPSIWNLNPAQARAGAGSRPAAPAFACALHCLPVMQSSTDTPDDPGPLSLFRLLPRPASLSQTPPGPQGGSALTLLAALGASGVRDAHDRLMQALLSDLKQRLSANAWRNADK